MSGRKILSEAEGVFYSLLLVGFSFINALQWNCILFVPSFLFFIFVFQLSFARVFIGSCAVFTVFYFGSFISNLLKENINLDNFSTFLQEKLSRIIKNNYSGKTQKFISYLLLNEKSKDIYPIVESFKELSIVHLVVISGFHMNLIKKLLSKLLPNYLPTKIKKLLIFSSLFTYSWATAFSIPSTRIFFEELGKLSFSKKIKNSSFTQGAKSIGITFLVFPFSLCSLSFILSYLFALTFRLISKLKISHTNELLLKTLSALLISLMFFSYKTKKLFLTSGLNQFLFTPVIVLLFLFYFFTGPFKFFSTIGTKLYEFFSNLASSLSFNKLYLSRGSASVLEVYYFLVAFSLISLCIAFIALRKSKT